MSHAQPPYPPQQPPPPGGYGPPPPGGGYGPPPPGGGYGPPPPGGGYGPPPPGGGYGPPPPGGNPPWGGAPAYSPTDAIAYGWRKFTQNLGPFIVLGVLILVASVVVSFGTNILATGSLLATDAPVDPDTGMPEDNLGSVLIQLAGGLLSGAISWVLMLALMRGALDVVDTGRTEVGAMFTRIPWGQAIVAGLLVGLAFIGGLILCIVGAIPVVFFLYYTNVAVLDGASGPDALGASFRFVKNNLGDTFVFALLAAVIIVVATCCTLGLASIVTTPLIAIAVAYTWRTLQGRPVVA